MTNISNRVKKLASIWGVEPYEEFKFSGSDKRFRITEKGFETFSKYAGSWQMEGLPMWALKDEVSGA